MPPKRNVPHAPPHLAVVRSYQQQRFWMFPADPHTEEPLTSEERNDYRFGASNAPAQIDAYFREFPDAAIGVATGRGLIVIDIDMIEGDGVAAFEFLRQYLPPTLMARTPLSGLHLYFTIPPALDMYVSKSARKILPGVCVRAAGERVIAPSVLRGPDPCGREWLTRHDHPIAELDEAMITILGGRTNDRPARRQRRRKDAQDVIGGDRHDH
jgi:hypothetical protein